ncbi:hydrolase Nlp/P60 [Alicyclobacillaceae bacterium I2511]|nr:hydrolase Nlp/P60 [Alicyclobacillaceae bacterium I2511]
MQFGTQSRHPMKIAVAACSMLAMTIAATVPADASSLAAAQSQLDQLQQQSAALNSQISTEQTHVQSLQSAVTRYASSLANVKQALTQNQSDIHTVSNQLTQLDGELTANEKKLSTTKTEMIQQLRFTYENGQVSYLSVLLQAHSFDDFLSRLHDLVVVSNSTHDLIVQVENLQTQVTAEQQQRQTTYNHLVQKQNELALLQLADQKIAQQEQQLLLEQKTNLSNDTRHRTLVESQIHLTQAQIQQIQLQTQEAQTLMQNANYVQQAQANLANVNSSSLLQFAESFMGVPYVWGGTSPSGFDCSGFTQYVFDHFGVPIDRTSEAQFAQGVPVSQSNLQPGDLVFFSTYAPGASHVGIYIGNNLMVDAEDNGVSIDNVFNSYWGPRYLGARQFLH